MIKVIFEGEARTRSKYDELAECWMAALMKKKQAIHVLALAQQDVEKLENGLSRIVGPNLVHYYRSAYYQDEDMTTDLGKYKEVISQILIRPTSPDCPTLTFSTL